MWELFLEVYSGGIHMWKKCFQWSTPAYFKKNQTNVKLTHYEKKKKKKRKRKEKVVVWPPSMEEKGGRATTLVLVEVATQPLWSFLKKKQ
jgi:capsule polysaccharide export protein KpsC/LpsZ